MNEDTNEIKLSHINKDGQPAMVDIGKKSITAREARARGSIRLPKSLIIDYKKRDIITAKGSVIQTAIVAGTQAVKRTADLIPFCHPLPLESIQFDYTISDEAVVYMTCKVGASYRTGVEMEALTGVSVALLTIYDMCKSAAQDMEIQDIYLIQKSGGKSDYSRSEESTSN